MLLLALPVLAQKTEVQFLSGHGKDDAVPWKFLCTSGANSGLWTNLPVPSQWDAQGFGTMDYQKDETNAFAEKGLYEHEFTVPAGWSGRRIFLVFEGVMTDTDARLNHQSVGPMHQGGFYRFKYEVTRLVNLGSTNLLEVTVAKHSANASINHAERNADYWVLGGICRPVYLEAVPPQFIENMDQLFDEYDPQPDGIVGPYRQREGNYYAIKEISSPIQVTRASNVVFKVENHFTFTDARDCQFTWQLRNFATPLMTNIAFAVLREGVLEPPAIPPGETGIIKLSAAASKNADALALRVADPFGRELWTWVWRLRPGDTYRLTQEPALHHAVPATNHSVITITAGELTATFSLDTGLLLGVQRGAQTFSLTNGPRLAVGRAKLRQIHFDDDGPDAFVSAKFDGDLKSVLWRVNGNGWINCDYTYTAEGTNDFFGVLFDYPEKRVTHTRWLGGGPYRVWKNRLRGVTLGVWENDYNHTIAGSRDWIDPEFKGFFAGVRWLQLDTAEGQITVLNNNGVPFTQVLTPEFPPANLVGKARAPLPECGLAFLDAIPPIGSEFKEARFGGPQGQPTLAPGEYTGSLSFYFGRLP